MHMMRTLLALLLAFILIVTILQADAVKEENEQRMKTKRNLLSETGLGRKANAGGTEAKDLVNKNSPTAKTNTSDSVKNNNQGTSNKNDGGGGDDDDDDDDTNESYQNYGNNSGSSTGSHHYFTDVRRPPANKPPTSA